MKLDGQRESDNVEDLRDQGGGGGGSGFGGIGMGHIGIGTIVIALIGGWIFGINPLTILGVISGGGAPVQHSAPAPVPAQTGQPGAPVAHGQEDPMKRFVSIVLADTEDVWTQVFQQRGGTYRDPKLVLFRDSTPTACGRGESATGPFYCPGDEKVYIDLSFYDLLRTKLGAPGDFAQAYVIAHEVGHHVQKLMGISAKVDAARRGSSEVRSNALSVRLELQADCFAGIWANRAQATKNIIEAGDIDQALNAASQIGDDTLQRKASGTVQPDTFTHGTSAQRVHWFKQGYETGQIEQCDTFKAGSQ
ncbi:neutral zinc metallopeptidase [Scleromatobacter humisilvae]|uniref:Neutral zinc metallopeptidase n=1 Tax=Scleromatobacter humisilvae TaxID=2897159 RepID=A0A9X2BX91_9BURK|nr:neutral zinc metallopeptidase [Scleromatobacter humisilvae]MCK9684333.1 neutral zinc metallopeptidase [Scleromatobacter humisilvae]